LLTMSIFIRTGKACSAEQGFHKAISRIPLSQHLADWGLAVPSTLGYSFC
jgi:hypothetical protein